MNMRNFKKLNTLPLSLFNLVFMYLTVCRAINRTAARRGNNGQKYERGDEYSQFFQRFHKP
jgi:hypothetical protein